MCAATCGTIVYMCRIEVFFLHWFGIAPVARGVSPFVDVAEGPLLFGAREAAIAAKTVWSVNESAKLHRLF